MKPYEIKIIEGKPVFIKEIRPNFYLFNDVFVDLDESFELNDERIAEFLTMKDDPYVPYQGAGKGWVAVFVAPDEDGVRDVFFLRVTNLKDKQMLKDAKEAYDEYRSWAGI